MNWAAQRSLMLPCTPDIVITPSRFAPFATDIGNDVLAINCGHLTKKAAGGTYALVSVHALREDEICMPANQTTSANQMEINLKYGDEDMIETHHVMLRTRVDVIRI